MKIMIERYDPDQDRHWTQAFALEDSQCRGMTVMALLERLSRLDPTLGYYHHSVCDHGICGRCAVQVNGKVGLACITPVGEGQELHLAPVPGRTVVHDLVTLPAGHS